MTDEDKRDYILNVISRVTKVPIDSILSKSRNREIVAARQLSHYYTREIVEDTFDVIGANIGLKNHCSVMHSCKQVEMMYNNITYNGFTELVKEIEQRLNVEILT